MNSDQIKGKLKNLKGKAKDAVGSMTGNKRTQAEGWVDRGKGAIQEKVGDFEDKPRE